MVQDWMKLSVIY